MVPEQMGRIHESGSDHITGLDEAASFLRAGALRASALPAPEVGIVLGSGLGGFAERLERAISVSYGEIPHMPVPRVPGHPGALWLGCVGDVTVACLQGRAHLYEGHPVERVVFGVRLLAELGCRAVLLTNAAGGLGSNLRPGDLMLIGDHINLTGQNPLVGCADSFVDMTAAYDAGLAEAARCAARELGIDLREGVYAAVLGPSYETPAEIRMLRALGADAVGMSTVPEVLALRHRGVRVGAVSCVTNLAAGLSAEPLGHDEVQETARRVRPTFERLLGRWIELGAEETRDMNRG